MCTSSGRKSTLIGVLCWLVISLWWICTIDCIWENTYVLFKCLNGIHNPHWQINITISKIASHSFSRVHEISHQLGSFCEHVFIYTFQQLFKSVTKLGIIDNAITIINKYLFLLWVRSIFKSSSIIKLYIPKLI